MTHPYIARGQAWVFALRTLMGYPPYEPARHTMGFCSSGPRDIDDIMDLTQLATDMGKDILHLTFAELDAPEPCLVSLAVHQPHCVQWLSGCQLYAASDRAPVELLQGDRRWRIDERNQLVSTKMPARHSLARGEQIALRRWRQAAADMDGVELHGNQFVPRGQTLADALPMESVHVSS